MKGVDKSNDIVVKRPQPWNVFGRLDALDGRLDALETSINGIKTSINEIKTNQKMTAAMFIVSQVPVWLMLLNK